MKMDVVVDATVKLPYLHEVQVPNSLLFGLSKKYQQLATKSKDTTLLAVFEKMLNSFFLRIEDL